MPSDNQIKSFYRMLLIFFWGLIVLSAFIVFAMYNPSFLTKTVNKTPLTEYKTLLDDDLIANGIHVRTGLKDGVGLMVVVRNCTNCHSAQLLIQNRLNAETWKSTIDWMQATQNLWDLGEQEEVIINYLTTYYPIEKKGRRENLKNIVWYDLH